MVPVIVESSKPVLDRSPEIKALSSIADIVRFISCSVDPPLSSVIKTVNESLPLKLRLGVYVHLPVTWTPKTEPALMRASLPARLGQEKLHETQTPQP